ncbi:uncharacterized protein [Panulirus ornatus]|uniref:uncharacterized protein n=1 Tax=Panulirus ornatus TaxID=150431 RepID=UPI003A8C781A
MDDVGTKLDVILEGIRQSEDHLLERKRRIHEVQEHLNGNRKEVEKLERESNQLENELVAARQQMASLETQLLINNQQKLDLEEQAGVIEIQVEDKQKSLELMEHTGEEVREKLLVEVKRFHNQVRLDNPDILARRDAIRHEQQHLALEETRLTCEIKVLQDNRTELESLQAEKCKYEMNIFELQKGMANREADLKKQLFAAQHERDQLTDPKCPSIKRLTQELKCVQEEGEYLNLAILGMESEHQKLCQELSTKGDAQHSHPSGTGERLFWSRRQLQNFVSQKQYPWNFRSFPDTVPSTPRSSEAMLQDRWPTSRNISVCGRKDISGSSSPVLSWSGTGTISTASSQNVPCSQADEDNDMKSYDAQFSRSTCTSLEENGEPQSANNSIGRAGGIIVMNTSQKLTPSTPRTFTRNLPPPTPQSEVESHPVLSEHLPGHFSSVSMCAEESEETSVEEDTPTTQTFTPVAATVCFTSNPEYGSSVLSYCQSPKSGDHHDKDTSKISVSNFSKGDSIPGKNTAYNESTSVCSSAPGLAFVSALGVDKDIPKKMSFPSEGDGKNTEDNESTSVHTFTPGKASVSAVDEYQDVPKKMTMSHRYNGVATLRKNKRCNESTGVHTFAPDWASMSASYVEENNLMKVPEGLYENSNTTLRSRAQNKQGNDVSYTKNITKSRSFTHESTQGNSSQNYQGKLHFKFRKTTMVHMHPSGEEGRTDSLGKNFKSFSNLNTRDKQTTSYSYRHHGTNEQPYPVSHSDNYKYLKSHTSCNFQPSGRRCMEQQRQNYHRPHHRNLSVSDLQRSSEEGRKIRFSNHDEVLEIPKNNSVA